MKARLFLVLAAISFSNSVAKSQQDGNFLGTGPGAFHRRQYAEPESQMLKVVNGIIYDANHSDLWKLKSGTVEDISGNKMLVVGQGETFILKNYYSTIALTKEVSVVAMRVGIEKYQDQRGSVWSGVYETWDCGTNPTPEQLKQMADEGAAARALIEKQKAEADKAEKAKIYAAQAKAIVWLQSQATNGSASAQCSLGLHYLNGQGCETNKELAVYWLTQAAERGDAEARDKLINLPK
jgi:TPR repeat protein